MTKSQVIHQQKLSKKINLCITIFNIDGQILVVGGGRLVRNICLLKEGSAFFKKEYGFVIFLYARGELIISRKR